MARRKGTFQVSANYEPLKAAPFDARQLVETRADLIAEDTWVINGIAWVYTGMIVSVGNDSDPKNNGLYSLTDAGNYTSLDSWQKFAGSADVYTKEETDNAIAEAIKHTPSGDLTQYLTKTDAETIYAKISSVDSIASLLAEEVIRAKTAEEKNANDIIQINALLNTISDIDDITSLKELAIWVEEYGAKAIAENTEAIESLVTRVSANELAINTTLPNILAEAKKYTDDTMVKADGTSIQNNNGTFSVKSVSTDMLVQGAEELFLEGGGAIGA